jgi:hypothetical protein
MDSATGNDVGRKNGRVAKLNDDVPRQKQWLAAHKDADTFRLASMTQTSVCGGGVEYKALQLGLLMDKLEKLDE